MLNKLEKYLSEQNILNDDATYMVGFSGGFDSCALLHMLASLRTKYDFRLCAAHLNHGWRETSNEEALNCYNFCQKYDIEFYTEKLNEDVPKTETAARDARYQFFERAAKHFGTNILLTAHTKSDNIETIVYRITKGTGISGLCGIDSVRESNGLKIYRPLLSDSRKDIEEYCKDNYLSPNVDESNFDTKYKRNFIRHEILPLLMQINQHADSAINTLIENAIADNDIIKEYIAQINKTLTSDNKISTKKFVSQSKEVQQRLIYDFVLSKGLDYDKKKICEILEFINDNAESKSGKTMSLTTNLWLFCSKDEIYTITENEAPIDTIVEINDWKDKYG